MMAMLALIEGRRRSGIDYGELTRKGVPKLVKPGKLLLIVSAQKRALSLRHLSWCFSMQLDVCRR